MEFDKNGIIICNCCHGRRVIPENVNLFKICPECEGEGGKDWVTHAMGRKNNRNLSYSVVQKNILTLVQLIKNEGSKLGIHVIVTVEQQSNNIPSISMPIFDSYQHSLSPMQVEMSSDEIKTKFSL